MKPVPSGCATYCRRFGSSSDRWAGASGRKPRRLRLWRLLACAGMLAVAVLAGASQVAAEQPAAPDDPVLQMVIELLRDSDRDMRALGLQQVREAVPGRQATEALVNLLPELSPDGQAGLVQALGERGDSAAAGAVRQMAGSPHESVRAAALAALGSLGEPADVPLLVAKAAGGSEAERAAASQSLARLQGDGVDAALAGVLKKASVDESVVVLEALAARDAAGVLPVVLDQASASDARVRLAAWRTLRRLAGPEQLASLIELLKTANESAERWAAELALLSVATRGGQRCAAAVADGMGGAKPAVRVVLLHVLGRAGGSEALQSVAAALDDGDQQVQDEAVRILSLWPDAAARSQLVEIVQHSSRFRHQVLALRGLIRLADTEGDLEQLQQLRQYIERPHEKRLLIAAASRLNTADALRFVLPWMNDSDVEEEAALAAVQIAERLGGSDAGLVRRALQKVFRTSRNKKVLERARSIVESL